MKNRRSQPRHLGLLVLRRRVPPAVRLTRFVVLHITEVTAAGRARVQVLAAGRRLDGRDRVLRRKREQRFRRLGRVPHPAAAVVMMVVMVMVAVVVVLMMVMVVTVFLAAFHVLQLQVNHVLLSAAAAAVVVVTAAAAVVAAAVVGDLIAVQVLVTESVTTERLGGQVVPRLDRFHGTVLAPVRR